MDKLKFYQYASVGLLLLNLILVTFLILGRPSDGERPGRAFDSLNMDKAQHDAFLESAKVHVQLMTSVDDQQKKLLEAYFKTIMEPSSNVNPTFPEEVVQLEKRKIEGTYKHFQEIKTLLKEEQLADYQQFMDRMINRILPKAKKNPHPPKEF